MNATAATAATDATDATTVAGAAAATPTAARRPRRLTARMRLTLSYSLFVVVTGALTLGVVYLVMRFAPNYPLASADPRRLNGAPSRRIILQSLLNASGLALLVLAVVGLVGGWLIADRVLRPLQGITRAAHRAAGGELEHRIALAGPRDEFTDLSDAFDDMLERLQRSFESQQRFAANASHELRTPLAISRTMLQVAEADPAGQDWARLVARLQDTNQRGIEIVDALLQLADISHTPLSLAPVDLARTATDALAAVREEAAAQGIALTTDCRPAHANGNAVLLRQLTVNLLHNALRHNLPVGGSVTLTTGPDPYEPGRVLLSVSNTGPRLAPESVAPFTEPFLRGRGRTAEADPTRRGHGLGLAIVVAVTDVHHGDLYLTPNPDGGLTAQLSLPQPCEPLAR